ncbi:hypothetical protein NL676_009394 [Syzygium grande]|nr:hypothetical protein NL676_009394 [Syzygium grande]
MERRLLEAAQKGNIDVLNDLIGSNGLIILEEMALKGAGHTLLHVACVAGHSDFVRELLKLMPKFAEKVNTDGFSPLHIAAARGDVEIARELLTVGRHLCTVKGWERRIPLHYAIVKGELNIMKVLLSFSPESVEETTAREETALHLAVKNNRFDAVVVLVEHLKQHEKEQVINWKDNKGNTVLHLATALKNFEVVNFLLCGHAVVSKVVEVNAVNDSGSTPLDVSTLSQMREGDREIREILARAGAIHVRGRSNSPASRPVEGANSRQSDGEPVINVSRSSSSTPYQAPDSILVIAGLIATLTYQAVLQPPISVQVDSNSTKAVHVAYVVFMSFNTFGLLGSVQMIIFSTSRLRIREVFRLSLTTVVLTYILLMVFLPLKPMDKPLRPITAGLLSMLPLIISVLLLQIQREVVLFITISITRFPRLPSEKKRGISSFPEVELRNAKPLAVSDGVRSRSRDIELRSQYLFGLASPDELAIKGNISVR